MSDTNDAKPGMRKWWEAAAWVALVAVLWGTDLLAKLLEAEQSGSRQDTFRLVSEHVTSAIAVLVMVPFLIQWMKLLPPMLKM